MNYLVFPFYADPNWRYLFAFGIIRAGVKFPIIMIK